MNWHSNTLHDSKGWIYFGTNRSINNAIFVVSHTKQRTKKICWVMFVNYNIFIMHFCSTAIMLIWFCKERIEDTLLNLTKYLWFLKHRCFSYMCFTINTYVIVIHTFFSTVRHYKMNIYSFLHTTLTFESITTMWIEESRARPLICRRVKMPSPCSLCNKRVK